MDAKRPTPRHIIIKMPKVKYKKKSFKNFFLFFNFYCYSITVVCLFSLSLHPTLAEPTSLPHLHLPPWFCPRVLYSSSCNPLFPLKNTERFTNLHVILAQGHANLLCIVPILVYVLPKRAQKEILKGAREKQIVTYKGAPIRLSADFSKETLQARRGWKEVFKVRKGKDLHPRLLYPAKLAFRMERQIKCFPVKVKLKEFIITQL